ncbi:tbp-1 interacting protein [Tritrichomonas foetus]|uniref:Tbp-1 interacting protein n=1 Tax=Tritrichomonas foetus TaxID=1144522 RepID=A0A1J4L238_9EUKA|nr:tbp-1 interacting protein [Tritrichomonas foetus]|eukprot:OHT15957.1 tbp-1 interacting protein [Tritrichomonas foetus]
MDQNIENLRNTSAQLKEKVEMLRSRRNELSNTKPIDELRNYRIEVEQKLEKEEERKNQLIQMTEGITPEDASKFQKDFNERCAQWRQRKNKCKEIVDQISEGCGKKPSEIFEELDLETDENLGLKLEYKDKKYIVTENS